MNLFNILRFFIQQIITFALFALTASALQLRDGDATDNRRHNGSVLDANFAFSSFDFSGVGWHVQDTRRQFALVSPRHFVCATHFLPGVGQQVRFIGTDGNVYTYTIQSREVVQDGGDTDLSLGTLTTSVDTRVIQRLSYANISEITIPNSDALVFGKTYRTGKQTFNAVLTKGSVSSSADSRLERTRMIKSRYELAATDNNDAYLEGGDSGSPMFYRDGSQIGIIGTNSAIGEEAILDGDGNEVLTARSTFAAYIPEYISDLNSFMADEGYQMSEMNHFLTTTLAETKSEPIVLRQGRAGHVLFSIQNNGGGFGGFFSVDGKNLTVTVQNTPSVPTGMTGVEFFDGFVSTTSREAHAVELRSGSSNAKSLRVDWAALPVAPTFSFDIAYQVDESSLQTSTHTLNLVPGYFTFVDGASDTSENSDPDHDGIENLLEYALGGDASSNSQVTTEGTELLPVFSHSVGSFRFLRRTDAAARELTYSVEYSDTLEAGSWSDLDLSPATTESTPEVGFELVDVPVTMTSLKRFYRLKVELNE